MCCGSLFPACADIFSPEVRIYHCTELEGISCVCLKGHGVCPVGTGISVPVGKRLLLIDLIEFQLKLDVQYSTE